jgi:sulfatase modifying factor 1
MKENERTGCCTPSRPSGQTAPAPSAANSSSTEVKFPEKLISLPGGPFLMGTDDPEAWLEDGEGPVREVTLSPFALDATAVTNAEFAAFVEETKHQTAAEVFGWSYVFILQLPKAWRRRKTGLGHAGPCEWWIGINGANWRNPEGPGSGLDDRHDHPVVHVAWTDAAAFAAWAGKRLPTEAEWEYAARGGLVQHRYPWGNELHPQGRHRCNIWQGKFPEVNRPEDGFLWTAPVRSFPPNDYGLYEMAGNVWEWCADYWGTAWDVSQPIIDPRGPVDGETRVMRGGSYLCHASYCNRYRVAARSRSTPDSTTGHAGFRCARDLARNA